MKHYAVVIFTFDYVPSKKKKNLCTYQPITLQHTLIVLAYYYHYYCCCCCCGEDMSKLLMPVSHSFLVETVH